MDRQTDTSLPHEPEQKTKSKLPLLFAGVVLLIILCLGVYTLLFQKEKNKKQISVASISPTKIITPTLIVAPKLHDVKKDLFTVKLPPIGTYCNGCGDSPPGWGGTLFESGIWQRGGAISNAEHLWTYISYTLKGEYPKIDTNTMIMPDGDFFSEITKIGVGESKQFKKTNANPNIPIKTYTYTRLADAFINESITVYQYEVTPTFDTDAIGREEALFVKDGHTFYIMFDWKDPQFNNTFEDIIASITFTP